MKKGFWLLVVLALTLVALPAAAHEPSEGRVGRAEVRFLQGMIDHHQMALDMANDCLGKASTDEVRAICEAVIAAQTPEIEQMVAWLADWYNIAYTPMSMLGQHDAGSAGDHSEHEGAAAGSTGESGGMMGGMGMMGDMDMMGMMGDMRAMMAEMRDMMGEMHGMMGMMMQPGMGEGQQSGMGMMGGMGNMAQATPAPGGHDQHSGGTDHSQHDGDGHEGMFTDPAMTMGMMAGFNRLTGLDYDIAWLESMIDHHDDAIHMTTRILQQAEHDELIALAENIVSAQTAENEQMEVLIATLSGG